MQKITSCCEICKKEAVDEKQKRKEEWITLKGDISHGINIWLEKPRKHKKGVTDCFMLMIGYQDRRYDFCSIDCLVTALKGKESL